MRRNIQQKGIFETMQTNRSTEGIEYSTQRCKCLIGFHLSISHEIFIKPFHVPENLPTPTGEQGTGDQNHRIGASGQCNAAKIEHFTQCGQFRYTKDTQNTEIIWW